MERIKFFINDMPFQKSKNNVSESTIDFKEIKNFLSEADNYSFDQIRLRCKDNLNKIVIDIATGIQYPAYDDFIHKIQKSKYSRFFDLK